MLGFQTESVSSIKYLENWLRFFVGFDCRVRQGEHTLYERKRDIWKELDTWRWNLLDTCGLVQAEPPRLAQN